MTENNSIDDNLDFDKIKPEDVLVAGPTFEDILKYSTDKDGAINLYKIQQLEGRYGRNGGIGCDVLEGPCSCGAWHHRLDTITYKSR